MTEQKPATRTSSPTSDIEQYLQRRNRKATPEATEGAETPKPHEEWQLKVPIEKDPTAAEGVKQHPLIQGIKSIGMLNVLEDGSEASIVPEKSVSADSPPIQGFLIPRVLDIMKAKHEGFEHCLDVAQDGMLRAVLIRGRMEDPQIKELASASKWAFMRAMEAQAQRSASPESKNS